MTCKRCGTEHDNRNAHGYALPYCEACTAVVMAEAVTSNRRFMEQQAQDYIRRTR